MWGAVKISPTFFQGETLIPFFVQGDLGSSHPTACLYDVRGGLRADLHSQRRGSQL